MRRGIERGAVAGGGEDRFQHRAGRALAVGSRDRDDRAAKASIQPAQHVADPLEAERDRLRMLQLDELEPAREAPHHPPCPWKICRTVSIVSASAARLS